MKKRKTEVPHQVLVCCDGSTVDEQPETFRFCPLGVQFYSRRRLPEYRQIELSLSGPQTREFAAPIRCEGVVVHIQYDERRRMYRHWILFIDPPEDLRKRFRCLARKNGWLCPHCENF